MSSDIYARWRAPAEPPEQRDELDENVPVGNGHLHQNWQYACVPVLWLAVGVLLFVAITTWAWSRRRKAPYVVRSGTAMIHAAPERCLQSALACASSFRGVRRVERVPSQLRIEMTTGVGVRGWGEKIEIDIREGGDSNASLVRAMSNPKLVTTLFDFGKNQRNVTSILDCLIHEHGGHLSDESARTSPS